MALTLFNDPMFADMERSLGRALSPMFAGSTFPALTATLPPSVGVGLYPMDVIEHKDRYNIVADAPGMTPDDIKVELRGDTLLVNGEKKTEQKQREERAGVRMHRHERTFQRFTRSFVLPEDANPEGINAKMEHGVLTVDIPKKESAQAAAEPKRIRVSTGAETAPAGPTTTGAAGAAK